MSWTQCSKKKNELASTIANKNKKYIYTHRTYLKKKKNEEKHTTFLCHSLRLIVKTTLSMRSAGWKEIRNVPFPFVPQNQNRTHTHANIYITLDEKFLKKFWNLLDV